MARRKRLFIRVFLVIGLSGAFLCYGLLCFCQSPTRIEEKIEIGAEADTSESNLLDFWCCMCPQFPPYAPPSQCDPESSYITMPYAGEVWAEVVGSEAGAPIAFGLKSPYLEQYWDDATEHVGEDTLVGYFGPLPESLLFYIHPGGPCSTDTMYARVTGDPPFYNTDI